MSKPTDPIGEQRVSNEHLREYLSPWTGISRETLRLICVELLQYRVQSAAQTGTVRV